MSCMHALPSFLVHWYVLLCILSYRFVVSFSTFSTFVCTSTLRQFFCLLPPARPPPSPVVEQVPAGVPHRGAALPFETGLPACHRAGLTVLQRFFLGFVCGSVIVWGPAWLRRGSYRTRPYYYRFARSWRH